MVKQNLIFCLYIATSWLLKIKSSGVFNMTGKQLALCRMIIVLLCQVGSSARQVLLLTFENWTVEQCRNTS